MLKRVEHEKSFITSGPGKVQCSIEFMFHITISEQFSSHCCNYMYREGNQRIQHMNMTWRT